MFDLPATQLFFALFSLVQGAVFTVLWIIVYARTQHKGAWFFVPVLPLIGVIFVPMLFALIFESYDLGPELLPILISVFGSLFAVAPLVVLAIRLLMRKIPLGRAADVFEG